MEIVWTKQAAKGYAAILHYLDSRWTKREVDRFENELGNFLVHLGKYPNLLQMSKKKGIHRGPINKHTMITYLVDEKGHRLILLNIRGTKQKP